MSKDAIRNRTSLGKALNTALSQMNELRGVQASATSDEEIHVHFDIPYKRITFCKYFFKLECLPDGSWRVFSHSLPHYLPMEAILRKSPYKNPVAMVQQVHGFLESLAARKGQVSEVKAKYPEMLKITNTATYGLVRLYFTRETELDLLRGVSFDLKYSLNDKFPTIVDITLPARTRSNLTRDDDNDLRTMMNGFKRYFIVRVINAIVEA